MARTRVDVLPAIASAMTLAMFAVYARIIHGQQDSLMPWVVALFVIGTAGSAYGAGRTLPHARVLLAVAAADLMILGLLGILTVGLPILAAGALCVVALARSEPERPTHSSGDPTGEARRN